MEGEADSCGAGLLGENSVSRVSFQQVLDDQPFRLSVDIADVIVDRFYFNLQVG